MTAIKAHMPLSAFSAPSLKHRKADSSDEKVADTDIVGTYFSIGASELPSNKRYNSRNSS
jgi:hypothetical protein